MLIDHGRRLSTTIALCAVEIQRGYAMLAESALEGGAAIHRFGCVISHIFIVVLLPLRVWGNRCATLERAGYTGFAADPEADAGVRLRANARLPAAKT